MPAPLGPSPHLTRPLSLFQPFIFHGHTLTTKISFLDVLRSIRDHAFLTSDFPVILSIEDHCTLVQQRRMAQMFLDVFGDSLVSGYLEKGETELPSPDQLKRRILLKHKKLPEGADEGSFVAKSEDLCKSSPSPPSSPPSLSLSHTLLQPRRWT